MDDAFVFLAAWKKTDPQKTVPDRLSEVYSESAISVTVTSVTNFIAFISGLFTPFRAIFFASLYGSIAVVFCYVYQIRFVGACMAFFGYVEKQGRHFLFFTKINTQNENRSWIRKFLFSTHSWKSTKNNVVPTSSIFIRFGYILSTWYVKIIIFIIIAGHVAVALWGMTHTKLYGSLSQAATYDSYFVEYYKKYLNNFNHFEYRFQIVIDQEINYADVQIQNEIENLFSEMEREGLISDFLTESWLRFYLKFLKDERIRLSVQSFNISDTKDFIKILRSVFLRHPSARRFRKDIAFNTDYTAIVGSRFLCQTNFASEESFFSNFLKMRKLTEKMPFNVFSYQFLAFWIDSIDLHVKFTMQLLSSVVIIIVIVCFVLISDVAVIFSVALSIVTIEISTLGYMALWDVELAPVSIIVLVMCAGFSVDYSAHIAHSYRHCHSEDPNERLRHSIYSIGYAIFQGSATTIISVLPLAIPLAYIFVESFKIIFLVILFSAINALIFLPVLLSILNYVKLKICDRKKRNKNLDTVDGHTNVGFPVSETAT
ncbi:patched domain-containing protein 3-like [Centruroides vittatus]|uniref:patched domain-containing protein 3-like n=1 Tax=Centruroides vittatus TaxID=120091 RepID=UPI0035108764